MNATKIEKKRSTNFMKDGKSVRFQIMITYLFESFPILRKFYTFHAYFVENQIILIPTIYITQLPYATGFADVHVRLVFLIFALGFDYDIEE